MADLTWTRRQGEALLREHGLAARGWTFIWDRAQKRGGQCNYRNRTISMSRYLVPMWTEEQVLNTLRHEVAHALTPGANHGPVWAAKMRELGGNPRRTHSNATVPPKWEQVCDVHGVIGRVHRRRQNLACGVCYRETHVMRSIRYRAAVAVSA
jgi:hypothetical protein